jgi:hypothetical protein
MSSAFNLGLRRGFSVATAAMLAGVLTATPGVASTGSVVPPLPAGFHDGPVTMYIEGRALTVRLQSLWEAEWMVRTADPSDRADVLGSLDTTVRLAALWDMTHGLQEGPTVTVLMPRPCSDTDCEEGVTTDPEPPADPPSTTPPAPAPPAPTCYTRDDSRRAVGGVIFHGTAFIFHQHLEYCAQGLTIMPGVSLYSYYSDLDWVWHCQADQDNTNIVTTPSPNILLAHSGGLCRWGFTAVGKENDAGGARPTIHDTYGTDGQRISRLGTSH